jgi:hypothetical protein
MGWFYGLKLHLVVNDCGEIQACQLTPGNVDESTVFFQYRKPVPVLCKYLFGKLIDDWGYLSQPLFEQLLETFNVQLITRLKKNTKHRLMPLVDKLLLRKRAIIESVIDQLKNTSQIEHSRHRSPINAFINIFAGLIAYCHLPQKPSLKIIPNNILGHSNPSVTLNIYAHSTLDMQSKAASIMDEIVTPIAVDMSQLHPVAPDEKN